MGVSVLYRTLLTLVYPKFSASDNPHHPENEKAFKWCKKFSPGSDTVWAKINQTFCAATAGTGAGHHGGNPGKNSCGYVRNGHHGPSQPFRELAKRLCSELKCRVTFIVANTWYSSAAAPYLQRLCASCPHITVQELEIPLPPRGDDVFWDFEAMAEDSVLPVKNILSRSRVQAFITTMFCTRFIPQISSAGIPTYVFFTSNMAYVSVTQWIPELVQQIAVPFQDLEFGIQLPGLPAIPGKCMPNVVDPQTVAFRMVYDSAFHIRQAAGLLLNTFDALEDAHVLLGKKKVAPVYSIGPVVRSEELEDREVACLQWLDQQPPRSVVFICLGSWATVSVSQLLQVEHALQSCGYRFLWMRRWPEGEPKRESIPVSGQKLGLGFVVETWVPQMAILQHSATAGFVSHCGWNSSLESISFGVPIIPWPITGDQHCVAVMILHLYGVGVPLQRGDDGFVKAENLKDAIVELMDGDGGRRAKDRALHLKHEARKALQSGGSSSNALADLVASWRN